MDLNAIQENERKWRDFLSSIKSYKHGPSNSININTKRNVNCLATEFANKLLKKKGGTVQFTGTQDVLIRYKHLDVRNETFTPKSMQPTKDIQLMKAETSPKAIKSEICIAAQPENEFLRSDLSLKMDTNDVIELSDDENSINLLGSNKDSVPKQDHLGTIFDNENSSNHSNDFDYYVPKKIPRSEKPYDKDVQESPNFIQMSVDNVGQVEDNIEIPISRKPDDKYKEETHNFILNKHPDVSNETFTPKSKQPINDIQLAKAEPSPNAAKIDICIAATTENELIRPKLSLEMNTKDVVQLSDDDKSISLLGSNKDSALKKDHLKTVFDDENSSNHSDESDYYTQKKILTLRKPNDETSNFILSNNLDVRNEQFTPKLTQEVQLTKAENSPKAAKSKICIAAKPENEFVRPDLSLGMNTKDIMELSDEDNSISLLGSNKNSALKQDHVEIVFDTEHLSNHSDDSDYYTPKKIPTSREPDDKDKEETPNFIPNKHPDVSNETFTPKSKQPINDIQLAKVEPSPNAAKIDICIAATTENELIRRKLSLEMNTKDVVQLSDDDKSISLLGSNKDSALKQDHLGTVFDNQNSSNHLDDSNYYTPKKIPTSRKPNDNEKDETSNFILSNNLDVGNETFTPKLTQEVQLTKTENSPKAAKSKICIAAKPENEFVRPDLSLGVNTKDVMEFSDDDNSISLLGSNKDSALKQDLVEIVFDNENLSNHSDDSDYYTPKKIPTSRQPNDNDKEETPNCIPCNHLAVLNETYTPKLKQPIEEIQLLKAETSLNAAKSEICRGVKPENNFVRPYLSLEMNTKDVMELSDDDNSISLLGSNKDSALKQDHLGTVFDNENSSIHSNDFDYYIPKKIPRFEKPYDKDVEESPNFIQMSVDNVGQVEGNIEIQRVRDRDKLAPSIKNDIDKPCSKWTVSSIAEYFIFDECVKRLIVPHNYSLSLDATYEFVQKDIYKRLEVVKGSPLRKGKRNSDSEILTQLKSISNTETGSRIILDALLIPVCSALGLQIEVDKNINFNFLPNCRFDYCIMKDNQIIGCVEAKSIKSLNDSSVAQALLQLTILQTALIVNETQSRRDSDFPVFAIVTDGHRFIYIQLKGSSLGFEHENGKVRVREVTRECDFKSIMQHITFLVNGTKQNEEDIITID